MAAAELSDNVSFPACPGRAVAAMDIHSHENQNNMPLAVINVAEELSACV